MTRTEAAERLAIAEAELARAVASGSRRDVAAYRIAVQVLRDLADRPDCAA